MKKLSFGKKHFYFLGLIYLSIFAGCESKMVDNLQATVEYNWEVVGSAGFSAGGANYTSLNIQKGVLYVGYQDVANGNKATVMNFTGKSPTGWENVGSPAFTERAANSPSLNKGGNQPYIVFQDSSRNNKATVMKYTGLGTTGWEYIGSPGFSAGTASDPSMDNYEPYVAFTDISHKATVMKYTGSGPSGWEYVGNQSFSAGIIEQPSLRVYNGIPYVAYQDYANDGKTTVMKYTGSGPSGWENVGSPGFSAGWAQNSSLYIYDDVLYVAYNDEGYGQKATVMKYTGSGETGWEYVGSPGFSSGWAQYTSLFIYDGTPYVAFSDGENGNKATVMKYTGSGPSGWEYVGNMGFSIREADWTSLYVYNGVPFVAYGDSANSNKATVMKYSPDPKVISITPNNGPNNVVVSNIVISGEYFHPDAIVKLTKSGESDISASNVTFVSSSKITCDIDLNRKSPGNWNVVVSNFDKKSATLSDGFTITESRKWTNVGQPGFSNGQSLWPSLFVCGDCDNHPVPLVSYTDNKTGAAIGMMYDGKNWINLGKEISTRGSLGTSLFAYNNVPYAALSEYFPEGIYKATVKRYTGLGDTGWESVGAEGFSGKNNAQFPSMYIDNGTIYVAFEDDMQSWKTSVMKYDGTNWVYVGIPDFSERQASSISLFVYQGTPYVAFIDDYVAHYNDAKVTVMKFNNGWQYVGQDQFSDGEAIIPSLYVYEGVPYVAYVDGAHGKKATVMKFTGNGSKGWESVGSPGFSSGQARRVSLKISGGKPYVAFIDVEHDSKANVMKYTGAGSTGWENVGSPGFSAGSTDCTSLFIFNGVPFVAYMDYLYSLKLTVMKFDW